MASYNSCANAVTEYMYGATNANEVARADLINVSTSSTLVRCEEQNLRECCARGFSDPIYACMKSGDAPAQQPCAVPTHRGRTSSTRSTA